MKISIPNPANPEETIEVELSDEQLQSAGLITPEQFTNRFSAELKRRTNAEVQTRLADHTSQLLGDDNFRQQALDTWGVKPTDDGAGKPPDPKELDLKISQAVEQARRQWESKELTPLQQKLQKEAERGSVMQQKLLRGEIIAAATEAGIKRELLKPGPGGSVSPVVAMLEPMFGYNGEHDGFFVKDGDTYRFSAKPEQGSPYMGARELLASWAGDKDNAWAVDGQRQEGPGSGSPGGQDRGGVIRLTEAEASDHRAYQAAQEKAAKTGGRVVVEGMAPLQQ